MNIEVEHKFTYAYYESFLLEAIERGYHIMALRDFVTNGSFSSKVLILRHDVDKNPHSLAPLIRIEERLKIRSSLYVRVCGAEYSFLGYSFMRDLASLERVGFEIGLHTNFLEFAHFLSLDPMQVLKMEVDSLRTFFDVVSFSCHRDLNYVVNSLPWVEENWNQIRKETDIAFQAYDKEIFGHLNYINEGLNPHLKWRSDSPETVIRRDESFYLLTHNHWWFEEIPFLS
jgi:hypothetical protein